MSTMQATDEDLLAALATKGPYMTEIAKAVGMKGDSVRQRFYRNERLMAAFDEAREALIDKAESNVMKAVMDGNHKMSVFVLRTLGKSRGYVMRDEVVDPDRPKQTVVTPDLNGASDGELRAYLQGLAAAVNNLPGTAD